MDPETSPSGEVWAHWNQGILSANAGVVEEFRATRGHPGGYFAGAPMLLLHHTGARSGRQRVTPLVYITDGTDLIVAASKGGDPHNPDWYHNLKVHPEAVIEVADRVLAVTATEVYGCERDGFYRRLAATRPAFAGYERMTSRIIPMLRLHPHDPGDVSSS